MLRSYILHIATAVINQLITTIQPRIYPHKYIKRIGTGVPYVDSVCIPYFYIDKSECTGTSNSCLFAIH